MTSLPLFSDQRSALTSQPQTTNKNTTSNWAGEESDISSEAMDDDPDEFHDPISNDIAVPIASTRLSQPN